MHEYHAVLDYGYVRLVEFWGKGDALESEAGIIEAARQSTQGSFRGWDTDYKLLKHLFTSNPPHASPFEFAGMTIEVQAPIFVFREWHRHRTQSYNEMSARYEPLPDLNYTPSRENLISRSEAAASTRNRQASGTSGKVLDGHSADEGLENLHRFYELSQVMYEQLLKDGWPKELARVVLPVGRYSRMRATANLRNWLAFLTLRMDPNAQWEIRQYAQAVGEIIKSTFPHTWSLFKGESNGQ